MTTHGNPKINKFELDLRVDLIIVLIKGLNESARLLNFKYVNINKKKVKKKILTAVIKLISFKSEY